MQYSEDNQFNEIEMVQNITNLNVNQNMEKEKQMPLALALDGLYCETKKKMKDGAKKQILNDVSMQVRYGELTGILGPSGSGKTTVLQYLANQKSISLNYKVKCVKQCNFKFIAQEDHLQGFYTVKQYMNWHFRMNYGFSISQKEIDKRISLILKMLDLSRQEDTIVGDIFRAGLLKGEKRRLSIALELTASPSMLVMDEPTTGLDSFIALEIMKGLKRLLENGIAIVLSIHQPSNLIYQQIDQIYLLAEGSLYFQGKKYELEQWIKANYRELQQLDNPAEVALQVVSFENYLDEENDDDLKKQLIPIKSSGKECIIDTKYKVVPIKSKEQKQTENILSLKYESKQANLIEKFIFLYQRFIIGTIKNPGIFLVRIAMYIMLCIMIGILFWKIGDENNQESIIARSAILFYVDAFLVFMSIAAVPAFIMYLQQERNIFEKEIGNYLYHPFLYQIAQFFASWAGVALISIISTIIIVFMLGLNGFGFFFLDLFLSLLVAESLAILFAIIVPHYIIAMACLAGYYGFCMMFQGFMLVKSQIPDWLIWGHYISFHTFSYRIFVQNEFRNIEQLTSLQWPTGQELLKFYDMEDIQFGRDFGILCAFTGFFQLLISLIIYWKYVRKLY